MNEKRLFETALWYAEKLGWPLLPLHSITNGRCTCGHAYGRGKLLDHDGDVFLICSVCAWRWRSAA